MDARDTIDRTVLVKLESVEGIEFTGMSGDGPFFCKVRGVDEAGVWVEHRKFMTVELKDTRGRLVPEDKQKPKKHTVHILLPWRNVQTMILFEEHGDELEMSGQELGAEKEKGKIGCIK